MDRPLVYETSNERSNRSEGAICPGDVTGKRTWLRTKVLWVRLPPGVPKNRRISIYGK